MPMLKPGTPAPAFSVPDHNGNTVTLKSLAGKTVVLWFYPKADTPGCTAEGCGFRDLRAGFEGKGAAILGASFDTPAENLAFAKKFTFPYPLLCDTTRELGLAYGATDDPKAPNARRIGYVIGPDGVIQHAWEKVDARAFPQEVLALL